MQNTEEQHDTVIQLLIFDLIWLIKGFQRNSTATTV